MTPRISICLLFATLTLTGCGGGGGGSDPATRLAPSGTVVDLGRSLFFDTALSEPAGQACASCHDPAAGFADPDVDSSHPVSAGAVSGRFGNRNAPTASYAALTPDFAYDAAATNKYSGGQFLDGRASDLTEQAKGPLLNPLEMANADKAAVVAKVRSASYATLFEEIYGAGALNDVNSAFDRIAAAIAAFERSEAFSPFSSKFDYVLAGQASFSAAEQRGFDLFKGRGMCTECHKLEPAARPLFTDFTYRNIGVPPNPDNPVYASDPGFVDLGLGFNPALSSSAALENGKFRVPTLRNSALTAPYMHNGVLQTLEQVVNFYNTRDTRRCLDVGGTPLVDCWPAPEVDNANVNTSQVGDLLLSAADEADIVAFLRTLSDGYSP
ncbi:MAG TPA: cytochrome-c peroxidase [Gammaproteobacteria bacterium]|nr:cytochrome-c peroxidase [Gammaproteobacteria bacterium]